MVTSTIADVQGIVTVSLPLRLRFRLAACFTWGVLVTKSTSWDSCFINRPLRYLVQRRICVLLLDSQRRDQLGTEYQGIDPCMTLVNLKR